MSLFSKPSPKRPSVQRPTKPQIIVPPPIVVPRTEVELGAYCFGGYQLERTEFDKVTRTECPHRFPWAASTATDRLLVAGNPHDQADPADTLQALREYEQYGLKWRIYQVQHPHANTQEHLLPEARRGVQRLLMSHCADNHPEDSPIRFALANWDVNAGKIGEENYHIELKALGFDMELSWRTYGVTAAQYMKQRNYLEMPDGRLVLFHGHAEKLAFYESFWQIKPERIIEWLRDEVRKATGKELYLVAVNVDTMNPNIEDVNERVFLKRWGFDAFAHYLLHGDGTGWESAMGSYRYWSARDLKAARAADLKYWCAATTGFDSRGWYPPPGGDVYVPTRAQLRAHLIERIHYVRDNSPIVEPKIPLYADDEIFEGGIIRPMRPKQLHDGYEVMETIHEASLAA